MRDLAVAMLSFVFAHTFSYTPLYKGAIDSESTRVWAWKLL